jgi:hypothetical protein
MLRCGTNVGKIQQKEKGNALIISELPFDFRDSVGIDESKNDEMFIKQID